MENTAQNEKWEEQKNRLKAIFATLNDEDFLFVPGRSDKMFEKIQCKTGKTRAELAKLISML